MKRIILASASPRRREILENIGLKFDIVVSSADESVLDRSLAPHILVEELAMLKGMEIAKHVDKNCIVIAADTIVSFDGKILEKPHDKDDARNMLRELSGKTHSVFTGVCVIRVSDSFSVSKYSETKVTFKKLSDDIIEKYIDSKEPFDKAGAYGIQGLGALLVEKIEGDYFNVVGLPVALLEEIFKEFDMDLFDYTERS